jgi:phosphatidylinositol 3-kinase
MKKDIININFIFKIYDIVFDNNTKIKNLALELNYIETIDNNYIGNINFIEFTRYYISQKNIKIDKNIQKMILIIKQLYQNLSKNILNVSFEEPILYPIDLSYKIIKINKIDKINSNTSPLLVYATISNNTLTKNIKFIIKKDKGLRKECIVSCLITLLQERLYQQALEKRIKIFEKIPTYQIIVLTNEIGIIEYVEDSLTIRMVNNSGLTLQNYILENNLTELIDTTKRRFMQSLAISCCISYILGLGDRHLDNIMINKKGQLFHIDYGYLMDNPLTSILTSPDIKITPVMIDFLGGPAGLYYKEFTEYIIQIYDIMRLYKNLIINYYKMLDDEKFVDWVIFKEKLESRFLPGLKWKDIQITLINEIETSNSNLIVFGDLCHNTKQSFLDIFNSS